jgi:hypothetical protein
MRADMYKASRTDTLCARYPGIPRAQHRTHAINDWSATYNDNVPNQIRDLALLRASHKGHVDEYQVELSTWMEGMEEEEFGVQ